MAVKSRFLLSMSGGMFPQLMLSDKKLWSPIHTCVDFSRGEKFKTSCNSTFSAARLHTENKWDFNRIYQETSNVFTLARKIHASVNRAWNFLKLEAVKGDLLREKRVVRLWVSRSVCPNGLFNLEHFECIWCLCLNSIYCLVRWISNWACPSKMGDTAISFAKHTCSLTFHSGLNMQTCVREFVGLM